MSPTAKRHAAGFSSKQEAFNSPTSVHEYWTKIKVRRELKWWHQGGCFWHPPVAWVQMPPTRPHHERRPLANFQGGVCRVFCVRHPVLWVERTTSRSSDKVSVIDGTLVPRFVSSMAKAGGASAAHFVSADTPVPAPILSRSQANALANWKMGGPLPFIADFDPLEIARQLTVKQMVLFCSITPEELLELRWTKLGGAHTPNVKAMTAFTTRLTNLVVDSILPYDEFKERAVAIKQWIKIASQCSSFNNFDALMAITCALTNTSVKLLKMTWDAVPAKRKEVLNSLQATVNFNQNFKVLRAQLHDQAPPCLPFLGMFLTDLTFVDVGNPATKTSDTGLTVINYDKHTRTAKIIGELQRFQALYRLAELPDFQDWLATQFYRVREKEQAGSNAQATHYRKSLLLEPREMRTPVRSGMFGWMRSNTGKQDMSVPIPSTTCIDRALFYYLPILIQ